MPAAGGRRRSDVPSCIGLALPILGIAERGTAAPPGAPHASRRLIDSHGRTIRDLRLSITDRCNFRCVYCMEPDVRFLPSGELLTSGEIVRLARVCVGLGVDKVRLTGGEPTVHPGLGDIIAGIAALGAIDLAMTTNGSLADRSAMLGWKAAGLTRISISIDSLDDGRFAAITRSATRTGAMLRRPAGVDDQDGDAS